MCLEKRLINYHDRSEGSRRELLTDLINTIEKLAAECETEEYQRFLSELSRKIFELISSSNPVDKHELLQNAHNELQPLFPVFINYVNQAIPSTHAEVNSMGGRTISLIIAISPPFLRDEIASQEIRIAMEFIKKKQYRNAICVIVTQVVSTLDKFESTIPSFPELICSFFDEFIGGPVEENSFIQETLGMLLQYARKTPSSQKEKICGLLQISLLKCLHQAESHQSLAPSFFSGLYLLLQVLPTAINEIKVFDVINYQSMEILRSRNSTYIQPILTLLPLICKIDVHRFDEVYFRDWFKTYIELLLNHEAFQEAILQSLSQIIEILESLFAPYVSELIAVIGKLLQSVKKEKCSAIFRLLRILEKSFHPQFESVFLALLPSLYGCDFTFEFMACIMQFSVNIPNCSYYFEDLVYEHCLKILCSGNINQEADRDKVILACDIVARFPFSRPILGDDLGHMLVELIACKESFTQVRLASLNAIIFLLTRGKDSQDKFEPLSEFSKILSILLSIAMTDSDMQVKDSILDAIENQNFDFYLSSKPHVDSLLAIFFSGSRHCTMKASSILSRLSLCNGGALVPHLRCLISHTLMDIVCQGDIMIADKQSTKFLEAIGLNKSLVGPMAEPIARVLAIHMRRGSTVAAVVFDGIASLIQKNPYVFEVYAGELLDLALEHLGDQNTPSKRLAALRMLSILASSLRFLLLFGKLSLLLLKIGDLLKTEQVEGIRKEAIRLIGVIGALDPHKFQGRVIELQAGNSGFVTSGGDIFGDEVDRSRTSASRGEEYYVEVVLNSLFKILKDHSLLTLHELCVGCIIKVCRSMNSKCSIYLGDIIPLLLGRLKKNDDDNAIINIFIHSIAELVAIAGAHIRSFSDEIMEIAHQLWVSNVPLRFSLLGLVEAMAQALQGEYSEGMRKFLPLIVASLKDTTDKAFISQQLKTLTSTIYYAKDFVFSLINNLNYVLSVSPENYLSSQVSHNVFLLAYKLLVQFDAGHQKILFLDWCLKFLSLTSHDTDNPVVQKTTSIVDFLLSRIYLDGFSIGFKMSFINKFLPRLPMLLGVFSNKDAASVVNWPLSIDLEPIESQGDITPSHRMPSLKAGPCCTWSFECQHDKDEWFSWIKEIEHQLLRFSPSFALRSCADIAESYYPLARELFNASFSAYWSHLDEVSQDDIAASLEVSMSSNTIPTEVMQTLLNLAEFMERENHPLPIENGILSAFSMKCHAFAKALYYQEMEFSDAPSASNAQALISILSQLCHQDSAEGILVYAKDMYGITLDESWYEKLQRWEEALKAYRSKWEAQKDNYDSLLGMLRCWHALGDWESIMKSTAESWKDMSTIYQNSALPLAASASWSSGNWEKMDAYVMHMSNSTPETALFRAVLAIKHQDYERARTFIDGTRNVLDAELTAMLSESYSRAYNTLVRAQSLSELEEVITYCLSIRDPGMRSLITRGWDSRLNDCQPTIDVWQRILKIRSLVLPPEDSLERWIKFAAMCRRGGRPTLSYKTLLMLMKIESTGSLDDQKFVGTADLTQSAPLVVYSFLKHNWEIGERDLAVKYLFQYCRFLSNSLEKRLIDPSSPFTSVDYVNFDVPAHSKLLAKCYLRLGEWQKYLAGERGEEVNSNEMDAFLAATSYDKNSYRCWRGWALVNFEMATNFERQHARHHGVQRSLLRNPYLVPAIQGFFRAISLAKENSLQDSLRLLTLWFKYGAAPEVNAALGDGFNSVPIENWLQVLPQLIARIHVPSPPIRRLVHHLLSEIGRQHPQALVYALTVASKSQSVSRRTSALAILDKMRSHSARLVDQAILISQELIRTAILWEEMWYEALEEASKLYHFEQDDASLSTILEPLYHLLDQGPMTAAERNFVDQYGGDLREAREHCLRYKRSNNRKDMDAAWSLYHQIFRQIAKHLPQLGPMYLSNVSPKLLEAKNMEISVPGYYKPGNDIIRIASFYPVIGVIGSKQRPRKLMIVGDDGRHYKYLLKGHEDLRQDERVMQLFGLVNTTLASNPETRKRHLLIERFSVVPLSQNTGLISWVPHCSTLHTLIREYRESTGILLSLEHRLMLQFAPEYEHLPLINKIEVFQYGQSQTDGRDLAKTMWIKSANAESWLDKRLTFTRSLAVMSMVGYILGLGDRHPSNLMVEHPTGRIVHIDFGDCFEVAMQREKFPERVPFRLTRMLIRAMEISGIEGSFRITCEHTMNVLRDNRESLMAVLEAFVYDPLINWRLLTKNEIRIAQGVSFSALDVTADGNYQATTPSQGRPMDKQNLCREFPFDFSTSRKVKRDSEIARLEDESMNKPEAVNAGALGVINRISKKLTGKEFAQQASSQKRFLDVKEQVEMVIDEAIKVENLCQSYVGWCAFW